MKKSSYSFFLFLFCCFPLFFAACASVPEKMVNNDSEVKQYADYFNKLCSGYGYTAFWWDTNTLINRSELTCRTEILDAIMVHYPEKYYSYQKTSSGFVEEDAFTAVYNMKTGINLGNSFDATSYEWNKEGTGSSGWILKKGQRNEFGQIYPSVFETAWGMPVTTPELIRYIKECGFNAVRIPVSWTEHLDADDKIDDEWLNRIHKVVNYVLDEGMYCIINSEHDKWICANKLFYDKYKDRFVKLWNQIGKEFIDCDERLIFAGMNEIVDEVDSQMTPMDSLKVVNQWNQLFIDTIRSQGGNNAKRNLIITPKGSRGLERDTSLLNLITDSAKNHLIVEVHNFTPEGFCFNDVTWSNPTAFWQDWDSEHKISEDFENYALWQKRLGLPLIISEYGAVPKEVTEDEYNRFYRAKIRNYKSILIKDTTKEQRLLIVRDYLGDQWDPEFGFEGLGIDFQAYIDGKKELHQVVNESDLGTIVGHPENNIKGLNEY